MISKISQKFRALLDKSLIIVSLITLFGALVRIYNIGYESLWFDEAVIYSIANSGNLKEIITQNAISNSTPPLFVLLINFIQRIGDSEEILRLIPLLGGIASIITIFILSRQFFNKYVAYILSLLVAISPSQVYYSQELREYSLTFLLATIILLFFHKHLHKSSIKNLLFMTLSMLMGVVLQYGLSLLIVSLNIVFLFDLISHKENRKSRFLEWVASQAVVLIAALLVIKISLIGQSHFFNVATSPKNYLYDAYWNGSISSLFHLAINNTYNLFSFAFPGNTFLFLTIAGFVFLIIQFKKNLHPIMLFIVPTLLTFILAVAGLFPYNGSRQDIFLTPMIFILSGFGINHLLKIDKKRWAVLILLIFPIIGGLSSTWSQLNKIDKANLRPVMKAIAESLEEGDIIYVYRGAEPAFKYYYKNEIGNQSIDSKIHWDKNAYYSEDMNAYYKEIDEIIMQGENIWLVFSLCYEDKCELIPKYISETKQVELLVDEVGAHLYYVNK